MSLLEQHSDKWEPEPMSGCYLWTGSLRRRSDSNHNFPIIRVARRPVSVPQLVLTEKAGSRPAGHQVSHTCNNWACVSPDHLCWETPAQNNARKTKETRRRLRSSKGYYYDKGTKNWVAKYWASGTKHIGCFNTPEEAHAAYLATVEKEI